MNRATVAEITGKQERLIGLLDKGPYDVVIIGRQDNFAWFTCGGSSCVVNSMEAGVCYLAVTRQKTWLVAMQMDMQRLLDEELAGYPVEAVCLRWCDEKPADVLQRLFAGGRCLIDSLLGFGKYAPEEIRALHFPLTPSEIIRYREIGAVTDRILRRVADALEPGMTDYDAAALLMQEYTRVDAFAEVLLVGIDERIGLYRHCIPSGKKIGKMVMLHPAIRMRGLHANVTRMVSFGEPDRETAGRFAAAGVILSRMAALCVPGASFADIHREAEKSFRTTGFASDWYQHFIGGTTAYFLADSSIWFDSAVLAQKKQAFDWFITITGIKIEELFLLDEEHLETLSCSGAWPFTEHDCGGFKLRLPSLYVR